MDTPTLQIIPETFRHDIYTHFLIARQGNVAMDAKTQTHGKGPRWEYEVIVVRFRKARLVFGSPQPDKERMPSDEEFGTYGWHYARLGAARNKFDAMALEKSPDTARLKHPSMSQFENSIKVETFDSQRRPSGIFQKRLPVALDAVRVESLVPA